MATLRYPDSGRSARGRDGAIDKAVLLAGKRDHRRAVGAPITAQSRRRPPKFGFGDRSGLALHFDKHEVFLDAQVAPVSFDRL
jgi:hypothetical protein